MNQSDPRPIGRRLGVALLAACLWLAAWPAAAQQSPPSLINDPEWQKRFLGSYGFLSGAEPEVNAGELEVLREVIDLMRVNPVAAATVLQQRAGADSSAALDFILANLQFQNGKLEDASKNYALALGKFPDFRRAHKNLGLLRVQKQDCKGGLQHLSRAVELGDRDGRNYGLIGYCYIQVENYLAAESAYRNAILQEPDTRDWKLGLAQALQGMKKHRESIALFDALLAENPEDAQSWQLQANAYVGIDEPRAAAVNLEAVRMLGKATSSTLVLLGDIYMNEGLYPLAKDAYVEVIQKDAKGAQFGTAYRAADLLVRSGAYAQAADVLAKIDKRYGSLREDDELKLLTVKAKLARAQGQDKRAAELLETIVRRDGTRGEALLELASYYRTKGQAQKALLLLERAEKLDSFEYKALVARAQLLVSEKDYEKAAQVLRDALAVKSEPRVERFLARVEQAIRR